MLSSITPLGERGRHNRWVTTAAWYVLGSALGGLTFGVGMGALGALWTSVGAPLGDGSAAMVVVALLTLAILFDTGALGERVPSIHRQVNEDWLANYRSWVYGGGFGWQLGFGVVTIVPTAGTYVTWMMALMTADPLSGALVGLVFGLARGLPILTVASATDAPRLRRYHRRMAAIAPVAHRAMVGALVVALAGSLVVAIGGA